MTNRIRGMMERAKSPVQPMVGMTHRARITSAHAPTAQKHWNINKSLLFFHIICTYTNYGPFLSFIWIAKKKKILVTLVQYLHGEHFLWQTLNWMCICISFSVRSQNLPNTNFMNKQYNNYFPSLTPLQFSRYLSVLDLLTNYDDYWQLPLFLTVNAIEEWDGTSQLEEFSTKEKMDTH